MIQKLQKKEVIKSQPQPNLPRIVQDKCTDCGLCAMVCAVFEKHNGQVSPVNMEICVECGHCGSVCPADAIEGPSTSPEKLTPADLASLPSPESFQFLMRSRRSVRLYKKKPVKREHINKILEAGRYTPTGANTQGLRYIVITDRKRIAHLRELAFPVMTKLVSQAARIASFPYSEKFIGEQLTYNVKYTYQPVFKLLHERERMGEDRLFHNAPALILVHGEKLDESLAFSGPVALFNCSLMAHILGIGCCMNGFVQMAVNYSAEVRKYLDIPRTEKCYGAMTIGYQNVKFNRLVERNPVDVRWM